MKGREIPPPESRAPSSLWRRARGGVVRWETAAVPSFYVHSNSAGSGMEVLFAAILAVPLILGEFPSLPKRLGHVDYHKWMGEKNTRRGRGAQWGVMITLSSVPESRVGGGEGSGKESQRRERKAESCQRRGL